MSIKQMSSLASVGRPLRNLPLLLLPLLHVQTSFAYQDQCQPSGGSLPCSVGLGIWNSTGYGVSLNDYQQPNPCAPGQLSGTTSATVTTQGAVQIPVGYPVMWWNYPFPTQNLLTTALCFAVLPAPPCYVGG